MSADRLLAHVDKQELEVEWILETHVHADHLSAATYLRDKTVAKIGIGSNITEVQEVFGGTFNIGSLSGYTIHSYTCLHDIYYREFRLCW